LNDRPEGPGGRVRFGEELHEAVARETREETCVDMVVDPLS
jgi:ADP-ribose pyrophosphatase YjhB (NUDIX family)